MAARPTPSRIGPPISTANIRKRGQRRQRRPPGSTILGLSPWASVAQPRGTLDEPRRPTEARKLLSPAPANQPGIPAGARHLGSQRCAPRFMTSAGLDRSSTNRPRGHGSRSPECVSRPRRACGSWGLLGSQPDNPELARHQAICQPRSVAETTVKSHQILRPAGRNVPLDLTQPLPVPLARPARARGVWAPPHWPL